MGALGGAFRGAFEGGLGGILGEVAGGNAESPKKAHPRASYVAPFFGLRGAPLRLKMAFLGLHSAEVFFAAALLREKALFPTKNGANVNARGREP